MSLSQEQNMESPLIVSCDNVENHSLLEETIEKYMGDLSWRQLFQVVLVSFGWIFDSLQSFISIFTDGQPTWHCVTSRDLCNDNSNICLLPKNSWSWDLPPQTSIVSDWSLECASSIISGLPASSFNFGCLVGGFVVVGLADSSFGRKNTMIMSCLVMSLAGLLTALSTNIWMYSAFRFVSGFGRASVGSCSLVLSSELVGKQWRGQIATLNFVFSPVGFLLLPGIAFLIKGSSWRMMYVSTCIPAIVYCTFLYFFVHESPRWLFIQGREEEFLRTLKSLAPSKKADNLTLTSIANMSGDQKSKTMNMYSAIKMLCNRKWAIQRLIATAILGFSIGVVYYGISLGVGNLNFNIYLSTALVALSKLPSTFVTYFIVGKAKRKNAILSFTTLCAVSCFIFVITTATEVQFLMELISFFSVCSAFAMLLVYTLELFPTCIKNSSLTIVRQVIMFGGVASPLLVAVAQRENNVVWWHLVFGLTIGICGVCVMWLPETKGETLGDTMDEEERKQSRRDATNLY